MKIRNKCKYFINFIFIFMIFLSLIFFEKLESEDKRLETQTSTSKTQNIIISENIEVENKKQYQKVQIEEEYKGYIVSSKLEIPKINLETYVLQNYSEKALNVCVTKFWGAEANEIGNFCIAGHNFQSKNMFHNLKNLEIGDALFVEDNKVGKVEYEIYDLYKVEPKDISCLSQDTDGRREVTLITCTNDSKKRIIVKAKEV